MWFPQPKYRYRFKLQDGTTHLLYPRDAKRVVNMRFTDRPETCWEVTINGVVRTLWPEDVIEWDQEPLPGG